MPQESQLQEPGARFAASCVAVVREADETGRAVALRFATEGTPADASAVAARCADSGFVVDVLVNAQNSRVAFRWSRAQDSAVGSPEAHQDRKDSPHAHD